MYIPRKRRIMQRHRKQKIVQKITLIIGGLIIICFIILLLIFAWYAKDLPSPGKLSTTKSSTVLYDRNGKILYEMYKDKNRIPIPFDKISGYLKKATVSIEDKNFYKHGGISKSGILRALINTLFRRKLQGGSTITQQLIKNVLLNSNRTASRKIREMILAFEVERRYNKNEILEMYLNEAPYGSTYYGIGSASMAYFGKQPQDLNLEESAFLAGLPQAPSIYSPYIGKKGAWKTRTKSVLRRMREDKYITKKQEKNAVKKLEKMRFSSLRASINAPHFVFYEKNILQKKFGSKVLEQGIKVKTTLSLPIQQMVEKIAYKEVERIKYLNATNTAVVVLDSKTGEILAMVGSYDFLNKDYGNYNSALALRQPGSSIKPITYATAFEKGYTPATVIMDTKTSFPSQGGKDYTPVNYDGKFRGPIQLRFALGNSVNIPAVKLLAMIGIKDFLQTAYNMGLTSLSPSRKNLNRFGLAVTLGGGETTLLDLTSAYSIFARGGIKKEVSSITEITNFKNKTIFKKVRSPEVKVLSPEVSFLISHILSDNVARTEEFGSNSYLRIPGKTVAVKTGTTNSKRDNWTIGYTKTVTVGVWVGNNDNSPMNQRIASGLTGASPIWHQVMVELLKKYSDGIMDKPKNIEAQIIDAYLGGLPHNGDKTRSEYFIKGTEPKDISPFYKKIKISKSNGKLANDVEIKVGNYEEKEYIVFSEDDPVSTDGVNRWQEGIDAWVAEQGDDKYHPPTEISNSSSESTIVSIKSPMDKDRVNSNNVKIRAKIISIAPLTKIEILIDGSVIKTIDEDKKEINESINLSDGTYELTIKATNDKNQSGDSTIRFGVNKDWDETPTPTPSPTTAPTPT